MAGLEQRNFEPLITRVANRIFDEGNNEYRQQFIELANSPTGQGILDMAFTSKTFDMHRNYEVGEFAGDLIVHYSLARFMIDAQVPGLSPAMMTEAKTYIASKDGQYEMFGDYQLGRYLKVGEVFRQDFNPDKLDLHTYSDLVESLVFAITSIGDLMGGIGIQLAQNFYISHMNDNRHLFLERLTKSWRAQLEADLGRHYGSPNILNRIRQAKGAGFDRYLRFRISSERQDDGRYRVVLEMNTDSANSINDMIREYPILQFAGISQLESHTVEDTNIDLERATSEVYKKMVNFFNSRGLNFGWRILFSRLSELVNRQHSLQHRSYDAIFRSIINSGMFPYAKYETLGNTDKPNIVYIRVEYLEQPYMIEYKNLYSIVNQVYYRYDKLIRGQEDPIINAYVDFYRQIVEPYIRQQQQAQQVNQANDFDVFAM